MTCHTCGEFKLEADFPRGQEECELCGINRERDLRPRILLYADNGMVGHYDVPPITQWELDRRKAIKLLGGFYA